MKKEMIYRIMTIIFVILTFAGAGYVLINKGEVNAGYAIVPGLWGVIFSNLAISARKKNSDDKK